MKSTIFSILIIFVIGFTLIQSKDTLVESKGIYTEKSEKEPKRYDQPDKAAQWLMDLRQTPKNSKNPSQLNNQYKTEIESYELAKRNSSDISAGTNDPVTKFKFENLGPSNFGGRIRGFVIKTDDSNQLLAGGVSGGVFKSNDQGQSWKPVSDFLPTLAIGSMIVDPDNSNRVFIGTGEGFFNFDAARGAGMFVSEDFGDTWMQLASTDNSDFYYVNRIARVPNSDILIAATRTGIYRSENLGQSWIEVSDFETSGRGFVDLKRDPSNPNHLLASHYGATNEILELNVVTPSTVAGSYRGIQANFGPDLPSAGIPNNVVELVTDSADPTNDACQAISTDLTGKIALAQRGSCNFTVKVLNAQNAGAIAVVIYQNSDDPIFAMGGSDDSITIPSVMISKANGETLVAESSEITANIKISADDILGRFIMESTDSGSNWTVLDSSNGLPTLNIGRMEIGFGNDGVTYIAASNNGDATRGLWRSEGQGTNFSKTASSTQFIERQGWYDLAIAVKPDDSATVFLGAIDQFKTTNNGTTIIQNSTWVPSSAGGSFGISKYLHSDHHGYFFDPQNINIQYIVGDGGVSKSIDNGTTFVDINNGLSLSQTYGISVSPDGNGINSGTQDNGSHLYFGDNNAWLKWAGGDGGFSAWDQQSSNYIYGSRPNGSMIGSSNGGLSFSSLNLPDTTGARFIQPFAINPENGNQLLVGTDNVFFSGNARSLSNANFQDITDTLDGSSVNAVSFSTTTLNQVFAGTLGGEIYRVNNLGSQNNLTNISPTSDDNLDSLSGAVTDIKTFKSNSILATRGSYFADRVIISNDGGNSWQSISGNLPDIPVYQITVDPRNSDKLYIGTELGLWTTDLSDDSNEWTRYDYGLAYTRVIDLVWHELDTLYVGTHGRGTYRASRDVVGISINKFVTTNSNNDDDGILDKGESGLYMLNLQNNSGFDISGAELDLSASPEISINNVNLDLATIPALSSLVVPIEVSLNSNASCLSDVNFDIGLSYDNGLFQQQNISVLTSANIELSDEDFIEGAESLASTMSTSLMLGNNDWVQVSNDANSGSKSWYTSNESSYADKSLISPWLTLNTGGNSLDFAIRYNTENRFDGVLLELREQGGLWVDIGNMNSVGYDGQLFNDNSAQGRFAWTGNQTNWRNVSVNLEESYAGKTIQFRFRMISDPNTGGQGFWVDDIKLSNVIQPNSPSCDDNVSTGGTVPFSGLWFDRSKNGHGFAIEPVGFDNLYFIIFYTYDDQGNPEWYSSLTTLEDGVLNVNFENGTLQKFIYDYDIDPAVTQAAILDPSITDGRLSIDFNSSNVISQNACQDGIAGRPNTVAIAKWKLNDQQGEWCIEPIITESNKRYPDMSGTWFAGLADTGWGFSIAQAQNQFTSINYYYDTQGFPRWSIGSANGFETGKNFPLQLTEVNGYGRTQTPVAITTVPSGSVTFNLKNALNNLGIDGSASVNFQYQGAEGGDWIRNNVPITIFTQTH